jgi:hypothetical protein
MLWDRNRTPFLMVVVLPSMQMQFVRMVLILTERNCGTLYMRSVVYGGRIRRMDLVHFWCTFVNITLACPTAHTITSCERSSSSESCMWVTWETSSCLAVSFSYFIIDLFAFTAWYRNKKVEFHSLIHYTAWTCQRTTYISKSHSI